MPHRASTASAGCAARSLLPLEELGRPRVDVMLTLSGIFRDLLPLQTRMLAEACWLAASADEPRSMNFVRKHALAHMAANGCDLETASLRVFSNADGAYGSNVNMLIDSGRWEDEDELGDMFAKRKCFAHGRNGQAAQQSQLMASVLSGVDLAYQNLESVELGVTTVDHYFDSLGGISRAAEKQRGHRGAGLYRRPDARRRRRPHAGRPGGARIPHPRAEPQVVRRHAEAWP